MKINLSAPIPINEENRIYKGTLTWMLADFYRILQVEGDVRTVIPLRNNNFFCQTDQRNLVKQVGVAAHHPRSVTQTTLDSRDPSDSSGYETDSLASSSSTDSIESKEKLAKPYKSRIPRPKSAQSDRSDYSFSSNSETTSPTSSSLSTRSIECKEKLIKRYTSSIPQLIRTSSTQSYESTRSDDTGSTASDQPNRYYRAKGRINPTQQPLRNFDQEQRCQYPLKPSQKVPGKIDTTTPSCFLDKHKSPTAIKNFIKSNIMTAFAPTNITKIKPKTSHHHVKPLCLGI